MEKEVVAIEIRNKEYRLVVGFVNNNKINIIYKLTRPLSVPIEGSLIDIGSISNDLQYIKNISDDELGIKININNVILVLPSNGLIVFNTAQQTNVISNVSKIERMDILNAISLVKKFKIPEKTNSLVEILADEYILDDGRKFTRPPIGETSPSIQIKASLYTLPTKIVESFLKIFNNARLSISRQIVSTVGLIDLFKTLNITETVYVTIEVDDKETTFSLVYNGKVYSGFLLNIGLEDLYEKISKEMNISKEEANRLANLYGINYRNTKYNPIVANSLDMLGMEKVYYKSNLCDIISNFFKDYVFNLNIMIDKIFKDQPEIKETISLIFVGKATDFKGFKTYMRSKFSKRKTLFPKLNLGSVYESKYMNCVAAIYNSANFKNILNEENKNIVSSDLKDESHFLNEEY